MSLIFATRQVYLSVAAICYLLGNIRMYSKQFYEIHFGYNLNLQLRIRYLVPFFLFVADSKKKLGKIDIRLIKLSPKICSLIKKSVSMAEMQIRFASVTFVGIA